MSLEFQGVQDVGEENWALQGQERLEQGVIGPPGRAVERYKQAWVAGRLQPGQGPQEPEWSRLTHHEVTWCAQSLGGTPVATATAIPPPARFPQWVMPPP